MLFQKKQVRARSLAFHCVDWFYFMRSGLNPVPREGTSQPAPEDSTCPRDHTYHGPQGSVRPVPEPTCGLSPWGPWAPSPAPFLSELGFRSGVWASSPSPTRLSSPGWLTQLQARPLPQTACLCFPGCQTDTSSPTLGDKDALPGRGHFYPKNPVSASPCWEACPKQARKQTQAGAKVGGVLASSVGRTASKATVSNRWQPGLQRLSQLLHVNDCTGKSVTPGGRTAVFRQRARGSLEAE